jgi:SAM-dependent MidA family methyltransferase
MLTRSVEEIPAEIPVLILSNELFDAFPVARLVQREEGLHELWVKMTRDGLDWSERDAEPVHAEYLDRRGVRLENGQYVDITPEWGGFYAGLCERFPRAMIATIDYGFPQKRLFDTRVRRYGTVAAFHRHQFNRDVLARPGRQDLTAHVNFDDLIAAGEARRFTTLVFGRQAPFLLSLGITAHELFTPSPELQYTQLDEAIASSAERQAARRLVLPEGIGEEMRVLVQGRGIPLEGWSFQKKMF